MKRYSLALLAVLLTLSGGRLAPAQTPREKNGVVVMVEGIGGWNVMGKVAKVALRQAGVPHDVAEFHWSHGFGHLLQDLQDTRYLLGKAEDLAEWVRRMHDADPDRPIYLVGHSAGTGIVVRAAELAPPHTIERMILLSSALSPTYDLRPALAATKKGIVSFHSPYDRMMLAWGTQQFGTVDRLYTKSAGLHGFRVPENLSPADRLLYDRLIQIPWHTRMILEGNIGQHTGPCFPGFMIADVAPWLH